MVDRSAYDEIIEKMKEISARYPSDDFARSIDKIEYIKNNFDIKLMFVGHFSAGKSALINSLMGKTEFLKEAQEPQTAIAAELIYDENESAFAYNINGKKEAYNPNKEYISDKYSHLEYRLNNPMLKQVEDFTIVDTPGIDAGIEVHTKALTNYIGKGSAYIVVIDQEKGGIDQTTSDFIQEISNYSRQIAILINKCDKITKKDADSIADAARFTLAIYGFPYKVYTISKKDEDVSNKLISIISDFNAQMAFDSAITKQIKTELVNIEKILTITKNRIYLDTFDLDVDIASYTRLEEQLVESFDQKREELNEELDNTVQKVVNSIKSSLMDSADSVSEALLCGNKAAAEAIIVETIRPVMLSAMKDISMRQIDNITETLDFAGLITNTDGSELVDITGNIATNLKNLIEQDVFGLRTVEDVEKLDKKKNIYHAITGLAAIATDIIAPWLEVVIILLPDIVNLLHGMFGESDNELAKRRFVNNVIPQIINKIYPQVRQNVETTTKYVLDEYEKVLNEKIESIKNNITEAYNTKNKKIEDFEKYKVDIVEDIEITKKIIAELG